MLSALVFVPVAACCPSPTALQAPNDVVADRSVDSSPLRQLTLLYTSDEHGWLESSSRHQPSRGGLQQLFSQLLRQEKHCVGAWPGEPQPRCDGANTVLLSGGDNFTGPALSSFFHGSTTAAAMRRLGYTASAFGNHELDFGRQAFVDNRDSVGIPYLAANLSGDGGGGSKLTRPYVVVERADVRMGVIGVATPDTPRAAASHRFIGMTFADIESTLTRVIPQVWAQDVDMLVLLAHACAPVVRKIVARHPEWRLSFVGVGHCHNVVQEDIAGVPLIMPDWRARSYARIRIQVDRSKPVKQRARVLSHDVVEVVPQGPSVAVDQGFALRMGEWQAELKAKLGETIGYTKSGLSKKSHHLSRLVLDAWLKDTKADIAVTTQGGFRQGFPAGEITRASVLSTLPFDNELLVCKVPGATLAGLLAGDETLVAGARKDEHGRWLLPNGNPVEARRDYRIVTTDFLYRGGDNMRFAEHDPSPQHTSLNWRDPVIDWLLRKQTSPELPLESVLK